MQRAFPVLLESFFTKRLIAQRRASPHTIGSYRDTFRLLLQFAERRLGKAPSRLTLEDLRRRFWERFWITWKALVRTRHGVVICDWLRFGLFFAILRWKHPSTLG